VFSLFSVIGRDLVTDRLVLRPWPPDEVAAVSNGSRFAHWAADFPAEGDQDIAAAMAKHATWLGEFGHRQMIERDSGLVAGSLGLFWPPTNGTVEIGYGVMGSRRRGDRTWGKREVRNRCRKRRRTGRWRSRSGSGCRRR
jgi:ribosomal-protein-alanine N-acetyltransferase